jgi:hypothetical protein
VRFAAAKDSFVVVLTADAPQAELRQSEADQLLQILAEQRPAVVLLVGDAGMGKTSLLAELRTSAAALGWTTMRDDAGEALRIVPHTRERDFREAMLAATEGAKKAPERFVGTLWTFEDVKRFFENQGFVDYTEADIEFLRAKIEQGWSIGKASAIVRSWLGFNEASPATQDRPGRAEIDPLVIALAGRTPLLLLIDDYRPGPAFAAWFEGSFLPDVRRAGAPLVVVITQPPQSPLERLATDVVKLGPLGRRLVRKTLKDLPELDPPLKKKELNDYVAAAQRPDVLSSLVRVLSLSSRSGAAP